MARAKIDINGPAIAKAGHHVESASLQNMLFDPQFVAARVFDQVTLTPVSFTGFLSDYYKRATHSYGKTFSTPPIVLVAGIDGARRQVSAMRGFSIPLDPGKARLLPFYEVVATTTGFELYVLHTLPSGLPAAGSGPAIPTNWRCTILQNSFVE